MVTYGDYFSRRTLNHCGISPTMPMSIKGENGYKGDRIEQIRSDMSSVYQTLYKGLEQKNTQSPREELQKLNAQNKIICAFYDSGVLTNAERDFFQTQSLEVMPNEREQISVSEANLSAPVEKAERVQPQISEPTLRNVR